MRARRSIGAGVAGDAAGRWRGAPGRCERYRRWRGRLRACRESAVRLNSRIGQYRLPSARPDAKAEILGAHHSGPCSQPDKKGADQSSGSIDISVRSGFPRRCQRSRSSTSSRSTRDELASVRERRGPLNRLALALHDRLPQDDRQDAQLGGAHSAGRSSIISAGNSIACRRGLPRSGRSIAGVAGPCSSTMPRHSGCSDAANSRACRTRARGLSSPGSGGRFRPGRTHGARPIVARRASLSPAPRA